MSLAVQLVQAVVFTPEQPSAYDVFASVYGLQPTQFQNAPQPGPVSAPASVAMGQVDGRNLVAQVSMGRIDLVAASIDATVPDAPPGQFMPMAEPESAIDLIERAAQQLAAQRGVVSRLAFVIRYVTLADDLGHATAMFSDFTGARKELLGRSDNTFQTNYPIPMPDLAGGVLNRLIQVRIETIKTFDMAPMVVGSSLQPMNSREQHALALNVDVNVLPPFGAIPVDNVGKLLHRLREYAVDMGSAAISGRAPT